MSGAMHLTDRDRELLLALAQKVRLFGQRQIAEHWWHGEIANTRRRLKRLCQRDLLLRLTVHARPIPELQSPLVSWKPGDSEPEFGHVAYCCQQRWRCRTLRPCTTWIASERTAQLFGGVRRGELKQPSQATHDLGVAAVWLRLQEVAPQWAAAWRSEDLLAPTRHGEKLPDAFIVGPDEQVNWVVEFAGSYDTARVAAFHHDCAHRGLPYQLW